MAPGTVVAAPRGTVDEGTARLGGTCRNCGAALEHTFVDLGMSPLCESYLRSDELQGMEPFYPLHVYVCDRCFLVQLRAYVTPETIFSEYAYFSSYSTSWLGHAQSYVDQMIAKLHLSSEHQVVEYGPVPFPRKNTTLWLPKSAEIYFDFRKHRYYRRHSFDHYMLYSVDSDEKRKEPANQLEKKS